jgi:cell division septum initiation protein DivIVA
MEGRPVTDAWRKGRAKGLGSTSPVDEPEQPDVLPGADTDVQRQALQVLNLAQRTAEEHVASAHRQAEKILADSRAAAEQMVRDAQAHANDLQREADQVLSGARASAEQMAREAQTHAEGAQRDADKVLSDARAQATKIVEKARASAEELNHQAQQRYDDVVGSLAARREALQRQIEALEQFDQDYRARLTAFMQAQLRALWVDEPQVSAEIEQPSSSPRAVLLPAQTSH